ncbi:potassium channel family protein [Planctellipticum variicoloris]|uniref:potassium channel family protein n=1 Tax=Planctellipticum variicoloris TaxID=3064265 RepID=UPI002C33D093|nr:potassium channel family protein [Planctomycetaceae bacterium SH412]HTN02951.1 potassium channel family protein [Planctomycetaceae bacterium]
MSNDAPSASAPPAPPKIIYTPLLVALCATAILSSLADYWPITTSILASAILLTGLRAVARDHLLRLVVGGLLVICLPLRWAAHTFGDEYFWLLFLSHVSLVIYFSLLEGIVLVRVIRPHRITSQTVIGAICGYLLIAYIFGFVFAALESLDPNAIITGGQPAVVDTPASIEQDIGELMYFSLISLTTVGYGDYVPLSRFARSLVVAEVLAGQLYLAAFVARLVGALESPPPPEQHGN